MEIFLVSKAAKRLGIHPSTLRDLENRGVIQTRRNWAGWRIYSEPELREIEKILYGDNNSESK